MTAQLYWTAGLNEDAAKYFTRSADHTIDPEMAVYATLNAINASNDSLHTTDKKIASLVRLAHKDKFAGHRDLIYYTVAQMIYYALGQTEAEEENYEAAYNYLKKSIQYNVDNPEQRSRSFLLLGDLDYNRPDYKAAASDYDSVDMSMLGERDQQRLSDRQSALRIIARITRSFTSKTACRLLPASLKRAHGTDKKNR